MKIIIFGCGKIAFKFITIISKNIDIVGFVDNNKALHQRRVMDKIVYKPEDIKNICFDYIIITSMHYNTILKQLTNEIGIQAEKILIYIGTKLPKTIDERNDTVLKRIIKEMDKGGITFSLSKVAEKNIIMTELIRTVPEGIKKKYRVNCIKEISENTSNTVIFQNLDNCGEYLTSNNIAFWKGQSYEELSQIYNYPKQYLIDGALMYGVSNIIFKGDSTQKIPSVLWNITNNKMKIIGLPINNDFKQWDYKKQSNLNEILYIPSPLYKRDNKKTIINYQYIEDVIEGFNKRRHKLQEINAKLIIALPKVEVNLYKKYENEDLSFISLDDENFNNVFSKMDVIIIDNSISSAKYITQNKQIIILNLDESNLIQPKEYKIGKKEISSIAYSTNNIDEVINIIKKILISKDEYISLRSELIRNLTFDNNEIIYRQLWEAIEKSI